MSGVGKGKISDLTLPEWINIPKDENKKGIHLEIWKPNKCKPEGNINLENQSTYVMGRNDDDVDILLEHGSISRRHAVLLRDANGGIFIMDLGSTHGSYANNRKLVPNKPIELRLGSKMKFGESTRTYIIKLYNNNNNNSNSNSNMNSSKSKVVPFSLTNKVSTTSTTKTSTTIPKNNDNNNNNNDFRSQFPMSFGKKKELPKTTTTSTTTTTTTREQREAEIATLMTSLISTNALDEYEKEESSKKKEKEKSKEKDSVVVEKEDSVDEEKDIEFYNNSNSNKMKMSKVKSKSKNKSKNFVSDDDDDDDEDYLNYNTIQKSVEKEISTVAGLAKRLEIPISHEVKLGGSLATTKMMTNNNSNNNNNTGSSSGHLKTITSIAMDPTGSRILTGSKDCTVKIYDFGGMKNDHKHFREFIPEEGNIIVALSYSPSGDKFLCCTASSQPKIYDREGVQLLQFVKGDPYIMDMSQTKGHPSTVTGGQWHPNDRNTVITCSTDGSIRIWDVSNHGKKSDFGFLCCDRVIKAKSQRGGNMGVTSCCYMPSGSAIIGGMEDGSIQMWTVKKQFGRPELVIRPAHAPMTAITYMGFSSDKQTLATRGYDDTIRLWDIRKFKEPFKIIPNLPSSEYANVSFSPCGKFIIYGTSPVKGRDPSSAISFMEVRSPSIEPLFQVTMGDDDDDNTNTNTNTNTNKNKNKNIENVVWQPRINQILCGNAKGETRIMYDPNFSTKGALMSSNRTVKTKDSTHFFTQSVGRIHNPHSLPMYREDTRSLKRKKEKERMDPVKSHKPEIPVNGPGAQGSISQSINFTQYIMQDRIKKDNVRDVDSRKIILGYAEKATEGPQLVGDAYSSTAPKAVLATKTLEEEEEEFIQIQKDIIGK